MRLASQFPENKVPLKTMTMAFLTLPPMASLLSDLCVIGLDLCGEGLAGASLFALLGGRFALSSFGGIGPPKQLPTTNA